MPVQSPYYFVFVLVLWLLALPVRVPKLRQALLLLSSYVFYAFWSLQFLAILIACSLINYGCGSMLRRRPTAPRLWIGVLTNLALLAYFKYLPILAVNAAPGSGFANYLHRIVMPIGVSFWTFQGLSYLFDLYREEDLDPTPMEFFLYMAFWPTVMSGPVCRLSQLLGQFRQAISPCWEDVKVGLQRILIGLVMKLVLAQLLASGPQAGQGVAAGFDAIKSGWGGLDVWILAIGFGFQLYFDFAGYSHIVIGSARLFGFVLPENFDRPYLAATPSTFWTRWHMSLSFWIRDYLFLPLATLRRETWWRHLALLISMVLFGIWHKGSALLFLWGTYQGLLLVVHRQLQKFRPSSQYSLPAYLRSGISCGVTFASISLGWIFFRANDLKQAVSMLGAIASPASYGRMALPGNCYRIVLTAMGGYFAFNAMYEWMSRRIELWNEQHAAGVENHRDASGGQLTFVWHHRWMIAGPILVMILLCGILIVLAQQSDVIPFLYTGF